jgi:glycosyltransferase involved in cell wall biosynthesis
MMEKAIHTRRGPLVLLFYDGYEMKAVPGFWGAIYSHGRRTARYLYRTLKRQQVWTGFYTQFRCLYLSLLQAGCDVRVNNFALALRNPTYPVGLAGYPSVLSKVKLPNPAILGPGHFLNPDQAGSAALEPRIRKLIQYCDWAAELYRERCPEKILIWPAGIDTNYWRDASANPKDIDVLVYDKIRWFREREVPRVLERAISHLRRTGRSFEVLRYGEHHRSTYMRLLKRSRALLYLCEHETQGLAYQEAMSCNVPVLAWVEGVLVDPEQRRFARPNLEVSSVPYFDARCGERFKLAEFEAKFETFWAKLAHYRPRDYVLENLSLAKSAQVYLDAYRSLM